MVVTSIHPHQQKVLFVSISRFATTTQPNELNNNEKICRIYSYYLEQENYVNGSFGLVYA
jgi:hypothetical protein